MNLLRVALTALTFMSLGASASLAQANGDMIGDWKYSCVQGPCEAFIAISQGDQLALTWSIQNNVATGKISSIIRLPLGAVLPAGVRVYTGAETFVRHGFQICRADGCVALTDLDDAAQALLTSVETVRVSFFRQENNGEEPKGFTFEVPVHGFAEAVVALKAAKP